MTPEHDSPVTLADAAATMFPGGHVTGETLLGYVHQGKLPAYRIGKFYWTTLADVREMMKQCRVQPKARGFASENRVTTAPGISPTEATTTYSLEIANTALDLALMQLPSKKRKHSANS